MNLRLVSVLALIATAVSAQVTVSPSRRTVRASGQAEVSVRPDQARIQIAIVTQAATADEASQQNAATSAAVFDAIRKVIGTTGEIRTLYYNLTPVREGNPSRLVGFSVTNAIQVTLNNMNITGRVIDTAISAGASRVDGLSLGLQDDEPSRLQVLRAAGQVARARAQSIAAGLGVGLGQLLNADESYSSGGVISPARTAITATVPTTIEPGTLTVSAVVTVEYEILP